MTIPKQQITDFIMGDANRLSLAQDVADIVPDVRNLLIATFLSDVVARIRQIPGTSDWIVKSCKADDPNLQPGTNDLLSVTHRAWPEVFVGLENVSKVKVGVWSHPDKHALDPQKWSDLQHALKPFGLEPQAQAPNEWWPAATWLGALGFFDDFCGRAFFELGRQILRNEAPEGNDARRLANISYRTLLME